MQEALKGKKTYLVLAIAAAIWFGESAGFLPVGTMDSSKDLLGLAGGATVTAKINRISG